MHDFALWPLVLALALALRWLTVFLLVTPSPLAAPLTCCLTHWLPQSLAVLATRCLTHHSLPHPLTSPPHLSRGGQRLFFMSLLSVNFATISFGNLSQFLYGDDQSVTREAALIWLELRCSRHSMRCSKSSGSTPPVSMASPANRRSMST